MHTPVMPLEQVRALAERVVGAMEQVIVGKREVLETAVTVLLAGGHLLIEDVPGVGKTMLAKSLARAVDADFSRVQFTPDLLPTDITGVSVFNQETRQFEFRPGAIFAHVVLGDEINRASPKTQSALLEVMEEAQVTVDGETHRIESPFLVIATQNPVEMEGTYPLPEAQRDRFMAQVSMGYPHPQAELEMLRGHAGGSPLAQVRPVATAADVTAAVAAIATVHASTPLMRYVVDLVNATRQGDAFRLGASPRASVHLLRAGRARAALVGRDHVLPDDIQALFPTVLAHRLMLSGDARLARASAESILTDILARTRVPAA